MSVNSINPDELAHH